ncbi:MAG: hypothetical protein LBE33_02545 [Zoogloeaceae bacterium]|nr:hypothetical protein [Zoogloeaceae bacterium]
MDKKDQGYRFRIFLLTMALAVLSAGANAVGLGQIKVLSPLGQPLRAEIELTASRDELSSLTARLASHEAFDQAGIEFASALSGVTMTVDRQTGDKPVIRITSRQAINEPFLDMLIELNWASGRLVREYTFLLDPAPDTLVSRPITAPVAKGGASSAAPAPVAAPEQPAARQPEKTAAAKTDKTTGKTAGKAADKAADKAPKAGQERKVQKGEYLRKIAAETRPEGVSLDQMLVAIFNRNKDAFIGNNMNRLKAGKILTIPEPEAVAAVNEREARKTISAHTADFNAYRRNLASAAAASEGRPEDAARQTASGKIETKIEEKTPAPAKTEDQLRIARADAAAGKGGAQGRVAALEEDLAAKDLALKEAQSRQAELEKNIEDLRKLLELKNQNLAELQQQAQAQTGSSPVSPPPPPSPPPSPSPTPDAATATTAAAAPGEAAPASTPPADGEKPAEPAGAADQPAPPVAAAPAPAPAPATPPKKAPPPPEPSFIDDLLGNPFVLGGAVLVLGLLILLAYRQRQKKNQFPPTGMSPTTVKMTGGSVFGATGGRSVDTKTAPMTDFSQIGIGAIGTDESVDPVAEADVYMAYGRDAQAEEILLDALKTDPARTAIHMKLLEIYAGRKNVKQFEAIASDLYVQTDGAGSDWDKATEMGRKLDPANPLFGAAAAGGKTVDTDPVSPGVDPASVGPQTAPLTSSPVFETELEHAVTVMQGVPLASPPAPPPVRATLAPAPAAPASATATAAPAPAMHDLDFDLDLDVKPAESKPAPVKAPPPPVMVIDVAPPAEPKAPVSAFPPSAKPAAKPAASDDDALDFDFHINPPSAPAPAPASAPTSALAAPKAPEPVFDFGPITLELDEPTPVSDGDVITKLELAEAYEKMGDKESARELLAEVVKEGNAEQRDNAQRMLDKLV